MLLPNASFMGYFHFGLPAALGLNLVLPSAFSATAPEGPPVTGTGGSGGRPHAGLGLGTGLGPGLGPGLGAGLGPGLGLGSHLDVSGLSAADGMQPLMHGIRHSPPHSWHWLL
jgi:hypothetical protein